MSNEELIVREMLHMMQPELQIKLPKNKKAICLPVDALPELLLFNTVILQRNKRQHDDPKCVSRQPC